MFFIDVFIYNFSVKDYFISINLLKFWKKVIFYAVAVINKKYL